MAEIHWGLTVQVVEGPQLALTRVLQVEAYDAVDVTVPPGETVEVQLQPGAAGQVQLLLVRAEPAGEELTYAVNDAHGTAIPLDNVQFLVGSGALGLLGAPPHSLFFTNGLGAPASISILIGRKAVPHA